jgi:hypothetical protein
MYSGCITGFPAEIVEAMMDCQQQQDNPRDYHIFEQDPDAGEEGGGFTWSVTQEGHCFWECVIMRREFGHFFERYPRAGSNRRGNGTRQGPGKARWKREFAKK